MRSIRLAPVLALALAACNAAPPAPPSPASPPPATDALPERTGVTTRAGEPLTLLGPDVKVGDAVPDAEVVGPDLKPIKLTDYRGKVIVLSVVPSLDTPVCERQTGQIARYQAELPPEIVVLTVSRDLPFAQKRVLEANQFATKAVSDYREGSFGKAFGVLVKESRLLARSVWVIDRGFKVSYREIVADQKNEPKYEPLVEAAKRALGG